METPQEQPIFLSIQHAAIRYADKVVLPEVNFIIRQKQHWAITGKSGSGKTSLLHAILGKSNLINGSVEYPFYTRFLQSHRIKDPLFTYRHLIGYVSFQPQFRNKQHMRDFYYQQRFHSWDSEDAPSVREYLEQALGHAHAHLLSAEMRFPMDWVVGNMHLGYLLDKSLIKLSNGETRRLLIAEALLHQPLLLMLDSPFTGLDADTRSMFDRLLSRIAERGTQLLLVTSPREIPEVITHVLELDDGSIKGSSERSAFLEKCKRQGQKNKWEPDAAKMKKVMWAAAAEETAFTYAIQMKHTHVQYGEVVILDDINWMVKKGEKWALLGPNGAGKSTLLSLITGDNPQAYANDICLFDQKRGSGESIWELKHKIGFVSPELHQYFPAGSTSEEVIWTGYTDTLIPVPRKLSAAQKAHAPEVLELLELTQLKDRQFKFISSGEQRLILLIRALIKNPPLLILDEPCQGLDQEQKDHFTNVIAYLCADAERTLIYVSHYPEEIPESVNKVLRLEKGKVAF